MESAMKRQLQTPTLLFAVLTLLLAAGIVWPLGKLALLTADQTQDFAQLLTAYNLRAVVNTLVMGAAVALAACLLGFVVAYAITLTNVPAKGAMRALFLAPLFAPSIMPAIGLIYLVGSNGLMFNLELYGALGVFLGALIFALPHAVMQISLALSRLDSKLFAAAGSLGAGALMQFATITLPHAKRGIANAFLIAFILTITDFGVPKMLGGSFPMLATEIYNLAIGSQEFAAAAVMSIGLLAPALAAYWAMHQLTQNTRTRTGAVRLAPDTLRDLFVGGAAWVIVLAEIAVIVVVIYGSFVAFWPYQMQLTAENYAFRNSTYGIAPWINSLMLAAGTAAAGTALCWLGAYASVRTPSIPASLQKGYRALAAIPICIPGTVLGLAWAMTFAGFSLFKEPAGAMALLICNTLVHLYTVPHLTAVTGLKTLNARYETVGESLGASRMRTLCRVIVPLSARELAEMFSYLFASAVTTISSVVFLYTPKSIVAAVAAIDMIDSGFISEGAAMATLIFFSALFVRILAIAAVRPLHHHQ